MSGTLALPLTPLARSSHIYIHIHIGPALYPHRSLSPPNRPERLPA